MIEIFITTSFALIIAIVYIIFQLFFKQKQFKELESVNFFPSRNCNYACKFCFHTNKSTFILPLEKAKQGLKMLQKSGMKKINFSGGEPFLLHKLHDEYLGKLVQYCKQDLKLESVTIVSNGSLINEKFFTKYGKFLDILAISCDSFDPAVLKNIGRGVDGDLHITNVFKIKKWCDQHKILFKMNTVVNSMNVNEDMNNNLLQLQPYRWKVFQCLLIDGENAGENALRDARELLVSKEEFDKFILRHQNQKPIAEDNEDMRNSYINLDEQMRFLNCQNGKKEPSLSILDVGVANAFASSGFDYKAFIRRGGRFKWSKDINPYEF